MSEQKEQSETKPVTERLADWLKENGVTLAVMVQTPKGEHISPDNFIPAGWVAVPIILEVTQNGANSPD